jgi:hypothetical protein
LAVDSISAIFAITMIASVKTAPRIASTRLRERRVTPQSDKSSAAEGRKWFFRGKTALFPYEHALPSRRTVVDE